MFKIPRYFIFGFVGLSILTAYVIHSFMFTHGRVVQRDLASSQQVENSDSQESNPLTDVMKLASKVNKEVTQVAGGQVFSDANKCSCTVGVQDQRNFEFEDPASCAPERKIYENFFAKISNDFRNERPKHSAEFPRACITYILNASGGRSPKKRASLGKCASANAPIAREGYKACLTSTYVNTLYNYFGDVADCLNIPQRAYLPKFFHESGFQLNAVGPKFDAGVAQFTGPAISDVNAQLNHFKELVETESQSKDSCRKIAKEIRNLKPASTGVGKTCGFVTAPENPLRSFFYAAAKYHIDRDYVAFTLKKWRVLERMGALGLKESDFDKEQLFHMLITVGYNSGAETAVNFLHGYLKQQEFKKRKITIKDFDFGFFEPKDKTSPEHKRWQQTFPAHIMKVQLGGDPKYGFSLKAKANQLNQVFKEGVCVPHSYLAL